MNFYETKMGSIFFNSQLPKLITALQDIASALSKPAPAAPDSTVLPKPAPAIRPDGTASNSVPPVRPDSTALPDSAPPIRLDSTVLPDSVPPIRPDSTVPPKPAPAIKLNGTALLNHIPAIKIDDMAEPNFLHDLLYWMYEAEVFGNREQLASFDADVTQAEELLMPALAQSLELFEQYQSAVSRRNDAEIERAFCCGYRTGANAFLSGLFITQDSQKGDSRNGQ